MAELMTKLAYLLGILWSGSLCVSIIDIALYDICNRYTDTDCVCVSITDTQTLIVSVYRLR